MSLEFHCTCKDPYSIETNKCIKSWVGLFLNILGKHFGITNETWTLFINPTAVDEIWCAILDNIKQAHSVFTVHIRCPNVRNCNICA